MSAVCLYVTLIYSSNRVHLSHILLVQCADESASARGLQECTKKNGYMRSRCLTWISLLSFFSCISASERSLITFHSAFTVGWDSCVWMCVDVCASLVSVCGGGRRPQLFTSGKECIFCFLSLSLIHTDTNTYFESFLLLVDEWFTCGSLEQIKDTEDEQVPSTRSGEQQQETVNLQLKRKCGCGCER